ncbi:hypothetical protein [Pirellula sp. SH-Sr6A]|uniref:hypothetical protein n=1 Tax=Pirellula sp. SH-Sr6A TaxID=1632865 RepID=UPI0011BA5CA4|nr:hypothetical protein [Pirellula sp. SH-Sr6A]
MPKNQSWTTLLLNTLIAMAWMISVSLSQDPESLLEERIAAGTEQTYADVLESFCERSVFPKTMQYRDSTLNFDFCVVESISRTANSYRWVCRAKYSGEVDGYLFSPERIRLEFSNEQCLVNQGDLQGKIETESIVRWMGEDDPFQRTDLSAPPSLRRYDAAVFHPEQLRLHLFLEDFYYKWDPQNNELSRRLRITDGEWNGVTPYLDASVYHPRYNKIYFFRRDRYERFDFSNGVGKSDKSGRIAIDGWWRLWTTGIDSALLRSPDEIVFFRNDEFRRFRLPDDFAKSPEKRVSDPLWSQLPDGRIDASFDWNGKLYFLINRELVELDATRSIPVRKGQPRDFGWSFR